MNIGGLKKMNFASGRIRTCAGKPHWISSKPVLLSDCKQGKLIAQLARGLMKNY